MILVKIRGYYDDVMMPDKARGYYNNVIIPSKVGECYDDNINTRQGQRMIMMRMMMMMVVVMVLWIQLHSYLHVYCLSSVLAYINQLVWDSWNYGSEHFIHNSSLEINKNSFDIFVSNFLNYLWEIQWNFLLFLWCVAKAPITRVMGTLIWLVISGSITNYNCIKPSSLLWPFLVENFKGEPKNTTC